jgi:dCMP deaminase
MEHCLVTSEHRRTCTRSGVCAILKCQIGIIESMNQPIQNHGMCLEGYCPRGKYTLEELPPGGSYEDCTYIHAETSVLVLAGFVNTKGATMFVSRAPCWDCTKVIAWAEIAILWTPATTTWDWKCAEMLTRAGTSLESWGA